MDVVSPASLAAINRTARQFGWREFTAQDLPYTVDTTTTFVKDPRTNNDILLFGETVPWKPANWWSPTYRGPSQASDVAKVTVYGKNIPHRRAGKCVHDGIHW